MIFIHNNELKKMYCEIHNKIFENECNDCKNAIRQFLGQTYCQNCGLLSLTDKCCPKHNIIICIDCSEAIHQNDTQFGFELTNNAIKSTINLK